MFTLIIPALMAGDEMPLPPLNTPALNQLRRFARFQAHDLTTAQLYQRFLCDRLALDECSAYASPVVQQMGMNSVQMLDLKAACTLSDRTPCPCCPRITANTAKAWRKAKKNWPH